VLFVNHTAELGGGEIALSDLLGRLDRERFEPQVCLFADGPLAARVRAQRVPVLLLPLEAGVAAVTGRSLRGSLLQHAGTVRQAVAFARRLADLIAERQVDVVYANSLKADLIAGVAARLAGRPCIWHVRDRIDATYLPAAVAAIFRVAGAVLPRRLVTNSHSTAATLGPLVQSRTHVVYSGTRFAEVEHVSPPTLPPRTIGIVGRICWWKGQDIFLRAAAEVLKAHPRTRFRIVGSAMFGEDAFEAQCRQLSSDLGIDHAVEFRGFRPRVQEEFEALDLVVHASTLPEPFGQVIVQAMALGRPIIAADAGGVRELLPDDGVGVRIRPGDPAALTDAMLDVFARPADYHARVARARDLARARFSLERTVRDVEAVLARFSPSSRPAVLFGDRRTLAIPAGVPGAYDCTRLPVRTLLGEQPLAAESRARFLRHAPSSQAEHDAPQMSN
jgi:glycosyltransferase involved in cell wall biosynthesis